MAKMPLSISGHKEPCSRDEGLAVFRKSIGILNKNHDFAQSCKYYYSMFQSQLLNEVKPNITRWMNKFDDKFDVAIQCSIGPIM